MGTVAVKHKDQPKDAPAKVISESALADYEARGWTVDKAATKAATTDTTGRSAGKEA